MRSRSGALVLAMVWLIGCATTSPPAEQLDDAEIEAHINAKLAGGSFVTAALNVGVESVDGVVTVTGEVPNEEARFQAERLARTTVGVVRVISRLRVTEQAEPRLPVLPIWPPPAPSSRMTIPAGDFAGGPTTVSAAVDLLVRALAAVDYNEVVHFRSPLGGVVLVARLERFRESGHFEPPPRRYLIQPEHRADNMIDFVAALVAAPVGKYRMLMFFVGVEPFSAAGDRLGPDAAESLMEQGMTELPRNAGLRPFNDDDHVHAFVYEYEQSGLGEPKKVTTLEARRHLAATGILRALKEAR